MKAVHVVLSAVFLFTFAARGQSLRVDTRNLGERVIALVPIIGTGSYTDPKRPLFAPTPAQAKTMTGIHSFEWQPSDDGKLAIVEFVAKDKAAFRTLLSDARVVKAFEKGKAKKEDIEKELRKYAKDYRFDKDLRQGGARYCAPL